MIEHGSLKPMVVGLIPTLGTYISANNIDMSGFGTNMNSFDAMYKELSKKKENLLDNMLSAYLFAEKTGMNRPVLKEISINTGTPMWKIKAKLLLKRLRYSTF